MISFKQRNCHFQAYFSEEKICQFQAIEEFKSKPQFSCTNNPEVIFSINACPVLYAMQIHFHFAHPIYLLLFFF